MSTYDWFAIAVVLVCLLISAAFAGSETALTASSRATMLQLAKQGDRRAAIVNRLLEARERLISALLHRQQLGQHRRLLARDRGADRLVRRSRRALFQRRHDRPDRGVRRGAAEDRGLQRPGPLRARWWRGRSPGRCACSRPRWSAIEALVDWLLRRFGMQVGEGPVDHIAARGAARRGRPAAPRGRRREARSRHVQRSARPARSHGVRRDDPPHRDDHDQRRRSARGGRRRPCSRRRSPGFRSGAASPTTSSASCTPRICCAPSTRPTAIWPRSTSPRWSRPPWFVPDIRPLSEQLKAFRRRKTQLRAGGRRIRRGDGPGDAGGHPGGDRRRHHRRARHRGARACAGSRTARSMSTAACRSATSTAPWTGTCRTTRPPPSRAWSSTRRGSIPEPGQTFTFHGFRFRVLRRERNRITVLRITPLVRKPAAAAR